MVLKWIDLAIENAKFNRKIDTRNKNIVSLKETITSLKYFLYFILFNLSIALEQEIAKRSEILNILHNETDNQPKLFQQLLEKIDSEDKIIEEKKAIRKELKKIPKKIEEILDLYSEQLNPLKHLTLFLPVKN
jgi:hypothetical protein